MSGLGKPRSRLGEWLDVRGIKQEWLVQKSRVNKNTVGKLCNDPGYVPSGRTMQRIIGALREIDQNVKSSDFWDI